MKGDLEFLFFYFFSGSVTFLDLGAELDAGVVLFKSNLGNGACRVSTVPTQTRLISIFSLIRASCVKVRHTVCVWLGGWSVIQRLVEGAGELGAECAHGAQGHHL